MTKETLWLAEIDQVTHIDQSQHWSRDQPLDHEIKHLITRSWSRVTRSITSSPRWSRDHDHEIKHLITRSSRWSRDHDSVSGEIPVSVSGGNTSFGFTLATMSWRHFLSNHVVTSFSNHVVTSLPVSDTSSTHGSLVRTYTILASRSLISRALTLDDVIDACRHNIISSLGRLSGADGDISALTTVAAADGCISAGRAVGASIISQLLQCKYRSCMYGYCTRSMAHAKYAWEIYSKYIQRIWIMHIKHASIFTVRTYSAHYSW